jgi:beta-mannosidase
MSPFAAWQIAAAPPGSAPTHWSATTVPNTAANAAPGREDYDAEDWWWRCEVQAQAGDYRLVCDGLATLAEIWWNDALLGTSDNMFVPFECRVTVRGDGTDRLLIKCLSLDAELSKKRPRPRWRVPMLEQQQLRWVRTTLLGRTPGWSPPWAAVGPWRAVRLERLDEIRIADVRIEASLDADHRRGRVEVSFECAASAPALVFDGSRVECEQRDGRWHASVECVNPRLWWPHTHGTPYLYCLEITAGNSNLVRHIGFRRLRIERRDGDFAIEINGRRIFARGVCWTPLNPKSLSATAEAYAQAVSRIVYAGLNMLRIGGTMMYEDPALYDALDAQGVLLWQDLMFANMDYPNDLVPAIEREVHHVVALLAHRPCMAVICGNSEGQQQAAMSGATRDRWTPPLFHEVIPALLPAGIEYVPSSTDAGGFPHQPRHGVASYYGVGAYLRPVDDARRSEVRFASECLGFANLTATQTTVKTRTPRDLGAGWDFDDVRDHYVQRLFDVDPTPLRSIEPERYLALGRVTSGEVMAQAFAEWRRARSPTRGALIWFLRDLWPGQGWGLLEAGSGAPKPCYYFVRRACAVRALSVTDEGTNGLAIHVINDTAEPLTGAVELALYRAGDIKVGAASHQVNVAAHSALEIDPAAWLEGWYDLSYAYRFGPPQAPIIHVKLGAHETFWLPSLALPREQSVGLSATRSADMLTVTTQRFAQYVAIEGPGIEADDNYFHLAPGASRQVRLFAGTRGTVTAINAESGARFS